MDISAIEAAYQAATGEWDTADWTHENGTDKDGEPVYCSGNNAEHCQTCAKAERAAGSAETAAEHALEAARKGDLAKALVHAETACRIESEFGDDPTWRPLREAIEAAIEAKDSARCECGAVCSNSGCGWTGSEDETVVVEWMPAYLRESHRAAGNSGVYPHNGAQQSRLERSCAEAVCAADPDWCRILE